MTTRTHLCIAFFVSLLAGCAAPAPSASSGAPPAAVATPAARGPAVSLAVANAGFEEAGDESRPRNCPPKWWCSMHSDPTSFRFASVAGGPSGRYLRGERVKEEPWALVTQAVSAKGLDGRLLRVSVDVDTSGMLPGGDGAGPVIRAYAPGGRVIAADKTLRAPGSGWSRATVELLVPKGTELIDLGVVVYGDGVAGFDNVAAEHTGG